VIKFSQTQPMVRIEHTEANKDLLTYMQTGQSTFNELKNSTTS